MIETQIQPFVSRMVSDPIIGATNGSKRGLGRRSQTIRNNPDRALRIQLDSARKAPFFVGDRVRA
jgi:hypothetical protein